MARYGVSYEEVMQQIEKDFYWLALARPFLREDNPTREHPYTPEELAKKRAFLESMLKPEEAETIVRESLQDLEGKLDICFVETYLGMPHLNLGTEEDTILVPKLYFIDAQFSQGTTQFTEIFFVECRAAENGEGYVWRLQRNHITPEYLLWKWAELNKSKNER